MEHNSPRKPQHRRLRRGDVRREAVDGRRAARRGTRDRSVVGAVERRPEPRPRDEELSAGSTPKHASNASNASASGGAAAT